MWELRLSGPEWGSGANQCAVATSILAAGFGPGDAGESPVVFRLLPGHVHDLDAVDGAAAGELDDDVDTEADLGSGAGDFDAFELGFLE